MGSPIQYNASNLLVFLGQNVTEIVIMGNTFIRILISSFHINLSPRMPKEHAASHASSTLDIKMNAPFCNKPILIRIHFTRLLIYDKLF